MTFAFGSNTTCGGLSGTATGGGQSLFTSGSGASTTGMGFPSLAKTANVTFSTGTTPTSFGGPIGTSSAPTGLSFGQSNVTTTPATVGLAPLSAGFSFGGLATPNATTTSSGGFLLGGTSIAPMTGASSLATPSTSQGFLGLGGSGPDPSTDGKGAGQNTTGPKDAQIPQELFLTTQDLLKHVKEQKSVREEITRFSSRPIHRVAEDAGAMKKLLLEVTRNVYQDALQVSKLKQDVIHELHNVEMTQSTHDTPAGLQYENTAPLNYFAKLLSGFESHVHLYQVEIDRLEKHLQALNDPSPVSPQDLQQFIVSLHQIFVSLAGRLYTLNEKLQCMKATQKERSQGEKRTDSAESTLRALLPAKAVPVTLGPTPFRGGGPSTAVAVSTALQKAQEGGAISISHNQPSQPLGSFSFGSSSGSFGTSFSSPFSLGTGQGSTFGAPGTTYGAVENQPAFRLQQPPLGNKRGKKCHGGYGGGAGNPGASGYNTSGYSGYGGDGGYGAGGYAGVPPPNMGAPPPPPPTAGGGAVDGYGGAPVGVPPPQPVPNPYTDGGYGKQQAQLSGYTTTPTPGAPPSGYDARTGYSPTAPPVQAYAGAGWN